ncbi:MAG TPA: zinc ribbon domain-containing protein [Candidatus Binatia bacterium]|nr:zinc ribbon domain-containing protein [Candidatus Binatia bacterium]
MAFCNSCGAVLSEGTKFCSKCGAAAITGTPAALPQPIAPGPPPSSGSSSALKIVLIIVGVIVLIGVLGGATIGIIGYRIAKSAKVSQKGDNVKVETPFGSFSANDPEETAKELNIEIYPGARVQKTGTATVTIAGIHTVSANFESGDSVEKICDFYRSKFPNASVQSSDQTHCSIVSGDKENSTTVSIQSSVGGDGSRFQIVSVSKKSSQ